MSQFFCSMLTRNVSWSQLLMDHMLLKFMVVPVVSPLCVHAYKVNNCFSGYASADSTQFLNIIAIVSAGTAVSMISIAVVVFGCCLVACYIKVRKSSTKEEHNVVENDPTYEEISAVRMRPRARGSISIEPNEAYHRVSVQFQAHT